MIQQELGVLVQRQRLMLGIQVSLFIRTQSHSIHRGKQIANRVDYQLLPLVDDDASDDMKEDLLASEASSESLKRPGRM